MRGGAFIGPQKTSRAWCVIIMPCWTNTVKRVRARNTPNRHSGDAPVLPAKQLEWVDVSMELNHTKKTSKAVMTSGQVFEAKIFKEVNMGRNRGANNVKGNAFSKREDFNVKENAFSGAKERYQRFAKPQRSGSSQARIRRAKRIADDLVRKFGPIAGGSYRYFCKCAYNLPESVIWDCYENACAFKVKNKLAYFLAATKAQMI